MAQLETWFRQDIHDPVEIRKLPGSLFSNDAAGNKIGVEVYENGEPVTLGGTVNGYCLLADGSTVVVSGTRNLNTAYIVLPNAAYGVPGVISIVIKVHDSPQITTLCALVGVVSPTTSGTVIDPSDIVPSLEELLAQIDNLEAATEAAEAVTADYPDMINNVNDMLVTRSVNTTSNNLKRAYADGKLRLTGTAGATRRLVVWNGANASATTTSAFIPVLSPGKYKFHVDISGYSTNVATQGTYTTFGNTFTISDGDVITLTAPAMIGVVVYQNTNYGEEGTSYTDVVVEAYQIFSKDEYARRQTAVFPQYVKKPGENSFSGFPHLAFPEVFYANGCEYIVSRAAKSHYAPADPAEWGGGEIDKVDEFGKLQYVKLLKNTDFQDGTQDLQGHMGGFRTLITPDGTKIIAIGWTAYNESSHDNFIAVFDAATLEILEYSVNPILMSDGSQLPILLEGNPLLTPDGHLLVSGYRSDRTYYSRSAQAFGSVPLRSLTFETARFPLGETLAGNECCMGYASGKLWCLFRNDVNNAGAILAVTENLEGNSGWSVAHAYNRTTEGQDTVLHEPRMLAYCHDAGVLWFCGAKYFSTSRRDAEIGYIDLRDVNFKMHAATISSALNYGGYSGFRRYNADEFDMVFYREGTGGPSDTSTAISSAVLYKRVNVRKLLPEISHFM